MQANFTRTTVLPFSMALVAALTTQSALYGAEPAAAAPAEKAPEKAAEKAPEKAPEKKGWETSAYAGATLTRGNSDTLLLTLSLDSVRKYENAEAALGISGGYGENNSVRNTEFIKGHGDYHELITKRFYAGVHVDGSYDGIANLDYRGVLSPLAGYYLIKKEKTSLSVEAGPALVFERYSHQAQEGYWAARLGERFEHKISDSTKVWQSLDYVARLDRWSDKYTLTAEVGIDTAITKKWSLRTVFQNIYESLPATNHKHNDMRLIAGTAYKF